MPRGRKKKIPDSGPPIVSEPKKRGRKRKIPVQDVNIPDSLASPDVVTPKKRGRKKKEVSGTSTAIPKLEPINSTVVPFPFAFGCKVTDNVFNNQQSPVKPGDIFGLCLEHVGPATLADGTVEDMYCFSIISLKNYLQSEEY